MSYDVWVWKGPAYTLKTINGGIARIEAGDEDAFEPDPSIRLFRRRVLDEIPLAADGREAGHKVWVATPNISDRLLELNLSFAIRDDQLDTIFRLVETHRLWLYDPQRALVQPPGGASTAAPDRASIWLRRVIGRSPLGRRLLRRR